MRRQVVEVSALSHLTPDLVVRPSLIPATRRGCPKRLHERPPYDFQQVQSHHPPRWGHEAFVGASRNQGASVELLPFPPPVILGGMAAVPLFASILVRFPAV